MTKKQIEKYRHTIELDEIGEKGQQELLDSKVFIVGVGGLGSNILLSLASLGVGNIGICDFDTVKIDNLPRQILFSENDIGDNKIDVALKKICL